MLTPTEMVGIRIERKKPCQRLWMPSRMPRTHLEHGNTDQCQLDDAGNMPDNYGHKEKPDQVRLRGAIRFNPLEVSELLRRLMS